MKAALRWCSSVVAAALIAGCGADAPVAQSAARAPAEQAAQSAPAPQPVITVSGLPDFTPLVEAYGRAVVNVTAVARRPGRDQGAPELSPDDPLYEFFRRFGFGVPRTQQPPARGEGSGFVISPDGYILTNAHVVDGASEVTVRTTDRREYRARVVGQDGRTDVAVLKIDAADLPTVRIGDPTGLKAGEWVIAIGSPFGFDNSVTAGIVSATARTLAGDAYTPFIQTDVAVNPGNSGGPLFNLQGEVVGINSQIYSRTGGYQGISFAIPIDVAMHVKEALVAHGRVQRGRIGVVIQEVNQALADSFKLSRPRGALVAEVDRGGPAARAGVKAGDVILAVDGREIERSGELPAIVAGIAPGTEATLTIWRDRSERKLRVKVGELEDAPQVAARDASEDEEGGKLGLAVRPLTGSERLRLRTQGRLVVERAVGPAADAGLRPGDVLIAVNDAQVESVAQFRESVDRSGPTVALLIERGGTQTFVAVRTGS
ncbi:MAG: DegQ family serine endoprotease [Steroidobacteraceae bacterium]|nr:DegQ family serine endoprotease [Steroidobacteraceae bacterium]